MLNNSINNQLGFLGTSVKQEALAGITTFLTMAYIVLVAPMLLSHAGIPLSTAYHGTIIVIALGCFLMGGIANFPAALGPGLGLLSYFTYVVIAQYHYPLAMAMTAIFSAGVLFFICTITQLRQQLLAAIPPSLGYAIAAGVGFFIAFIALKNIHLIQADPHTLVKLGSLHDAHRLLFFAAFIAICTLTHYRVPGALFIVFVGTALLLLLLPGEMSPSALKSSAESDVLPLLSLTAPKVDMNFIMIVFTFLMVSLFDSCGTLIGLTQQLPDSEVSFADHPRLKKALLAESIGMLLAPLFYVTSVCPFVESAAGIAAGGRSGLTPVVTGCCFLAMWPLLPLIRFIPDAAVSAALFYTACLMIKPIAKIDWQDSVAYIPAVVTLFLIPLTFSITDGLGFGILTYVAMALFQQRWRQCHPILWVFAVLFLLYFLLR